MKYIPLIFLFGLPVCSMGAPDYFVVGGSTLTVQITPAADPFFKQAILDWIRISAHGVSAYYGRFPVPTVRINVHVKPRERHRRRRRLWRAPHRD